MTMVPEKRGKLIVNSDEGPIPQALGRGFQKNVAGRFGGCLIRLEYCVLMAETGGRFRDADV
jgi:hypothetical protein